MAWVAAERAAVARVVVMAVVMAAATAEVARVEAAPMVAHSSARRQHTLVGTSGVGL